MTFDFNTVFPTPNSWFIPTVEYRGQGKATFDDPPGTVSGPVTVRFDEFGDTTLQMHAEEYEAEPELKAHRSFSMAMLLTGSRPVAVGSGTMWDGFGVNRCTNLEIVISEPKDGKFTLSGGVSFRSQIGFMPDDGKLPIEFYLSGLYILSSYVDII